MSEEQDKSYRQFFSFPRMVEDLIRLFVGKKWCRRLDFATLEKVSERDVSPELIRREKDLLWRLKIRGRNGKDAGWFYVYLHLEFQTRPDPFMAIRAGTYRFLLWEDLIRRKAFTPSGMLPPVLSVVVYNGEEPWLGPTAAFDLVEPLPGLAKPADLLSFRLLDLRRIPAAELDGVASPVAALFRLEQCKAAAELYPVSSDLAAMVSGRDDHGLEDAFVVFINEVILRRLMPPGSRPPRIGRLVEVPSMLEQRIDRWTQAWERQGWQKGHEEGRKKGLSEGRKKGKQEGLREGEAEVVLRLLERKLGPLPAWAKERVRSADAERLLVWAERILTAGSLNDVFVD
jgi:hypothetical protein